MPVYMIQTAEGDAVKIGHARDVRSRFYDMQSCSPYEMKLLAVIDGGKTEERRLQEEFSHLRIKNEWFSFDEKMAMYASSFPPPAEFVTRKKVGRRSGPFIPKNMRKKGKPHYESAGAKQVRRFLTRTGWTYARLAEEIGCTRQCIGLIVKGRNSPSPATLVKLRKMHGMKRLQPEHFVGGDAS